jgi:hypothetical protein
MLWVSEMTNHERGLFEFVFQSLKAYFDFQREVVARSYTAKSANAKANVETKDLDWLLEGLANQVQQISLVVEEEGWMDEEYTTEEAKDAARRMHDEPESPFKSFLAKQNTPSRTAVVSKTTSPRDKNSLLSVGYGIDDLFCLVYSVFFHSLLTARRSSDRSYVVRGSHIGVFSPSSQGKGLRYDATFDVQTPNNKLAFSPTKSMLHKQDEKLLLLHPEEKNKIFCVDLERGMLRLYFLHFWDHYYFFSVLRILLAFFLTCRQSG